MKRIAAAVVSILLAMPAWADFQDRLDAAGCLAMATDPGGSEEQGR